MCGLVFNYYQQIAAASYFEMWKLYIAINVIRTEPFLPKLAGSTGLQGLSVQINGINWKWLVLLHSCLCSESLFHSRHIFYSIHFRLCC
jgi:hypothetical protein